MQIQSREDYDYYFSEVNTNPSVIYYNHIGLGLPKYIWTLANTPQELQSRLVRQWLNSRTYISDRGCLLDRNDEYTWFLKTSGVRPIAPYRFDELADISFSDLMYKRAEAIRDLSIQLDKPIQYFWSGGIDSFPPFLALRDVCPDRLFVITTEECISNSPEGEMYNKYVKDLDHYIHQDTSVDIFSLPDTHKFIVVEGTYADVLWNAFTPVDRYMRHLGIYKDEREPSQLTASKRWYYRQRLGFGLRYFRMVHCHQGDYIDVNSLQSFWFDDLIERWFINKSINGELDIVSRTQNNDNYHLQKMPAREFVRKWEPAGGVHTKPRNGLAVYSPVGRELDNNTVKRRDHNWIWENKSWPMVAILNDGHVIWQSHKNFLTPEHLIKLVDNKIIESGALDSWL